MNHQWSKGEEFERDLGDLVASTLGPGLDVFSYLRPRTELWVGRRFAGLTAFHRTFRSCNRAFHQDPAQRLDHWCGVCDKCCFIDLILAPFLAATELATVFGGSEPLDNPANEPRFRSLLGFEADTKPFECVGDADECRAALRLSRPSATTAPAPPWSSACGRTSRPRSLPPVPTTRLLEPRGPHRIPDRYAPTDLLVRAR